MRTIQIEQDINCRTIGLCSYGAHIDRELQDLTCRDRSFDCSGKDWEKAEHVLLSKDLGRAFLYARYDADLSAAGLERLGVAKWNPRKCRRWMGRPD